MSIAMRHWRSKSISEEKAAALNPIRSPIVLRKDQRSYENEESVKKVPKSKTKRDTTRKEHRISLEQDVQDLQARLTGQRVTKGILEQALARASSVQVHADGTCIPQHTHRLIKDIALLELEVVHLEQYLLSLYRKAFEVKIQEQTCVSKVLNKQEVSSLYQDVQPHQNVQGSPRTAKMHLSQQLETPKLAKKSLHAKSGSLLFRKLEATTDKDGFNVDEKGAARRRLSISYSQPITLSRKEAKGSPSTVTSELWREVISADANASVNYTEASPGRFMSESPNKLSEELVRCMAAIYCKLADPPIPHLGSISPSPSHSSMSTLSSKELSSDGWSPNWRKDGLCSASPTRTSQWRFATDNRSPYTSMVAVHWISVDNDRLLYAEKMLQNFRYLVQELEKLNPGKLKHEEKLAFWLNIYNALMMHAYLAYGIPKSHIKRVSLLQKASYKIGSHSINAHMIEHSFLGCKSSRPSQWFQSLLSPVSKLRVGHHRQVYALDKPEPLACFAVCCGGYSDPAVRVYTGKNVYQELDAAKREFLQANIIVRKDNKVLMPRVLEAFARESSMSTLGLLQWICVNVSEHQRRDLRTCMKVRSYNRCIEWTPYNFNFRYLFVRDLARWFPPNS
ncbi:hypothetical protein GOP47_0003993 [Adiantum capillus-veneris]|uniref:Electron transporter n=1 Tax=Adiantum capillus-veneris TaxID=13818 RepID=A0A9D4V7C6_ADICA|nr:hypothetical protein GOP47_0003993 [Adiantum capillus-veneris]